MSLPSPPAPVRQKRTHGKAPEADETLKGLAIVVITLLAPLLGGAMELKVQGMLCVVAALLIVTAPPKRSLGRTVNLVFLSVAALGIVSFLPRAVVGDGAWQQLLPADLLLRGVIHSPQPWLSFEAMGLLFLGLVWAYYVLSHTWGGHSRSRSIRIYAFGMAVIVALFLRAHWTREPVPFWPAESEYLGFFKNRNHTGNVIALAGIMMAALAFTDLRRKKRIGALWLLGAAAVATALVWNYSRAGILLFFGGTVIWLLWSVYTSRSKGYAASVLSLILVLLFAFLFSGSKTLERFRNETLTPFAPAKDFRFQLQRDALALSSDAPLVGAGLGNFPEAFAMSRHHSVAENRAIHPESDWLQLAVEMGWFAPLLISGALFLWLRRCPPFDTDRDRHLRAAAAVCVAAFAAHGVFDVPGHRLGAVFPMLFLASVAIRPGNSSMSAAWQPAVFRCCGLILLSLGTWWLASTQASSTLPTTAVLQRMKSQIVEASRRNEYSTVIDLCSKALKIAPLDGSLYYYRGAALALSHQGTSRAIADFQAARKLQPLWADLCIREGEVWLARGKFPDCAEAWSEALRREREDAPKLFRHMLERARSKPFLRQRLRKVVGDNCDYLLVYLASADRFEFDLESQWLMGSDSSPLHRFSEGQLGQLFELWWVKGDKSVLLSAIQRRPEWERIGWRWLAQHSSEAGDFQRAYQIARKSVAEPALPGLTGPGSEENLWRRLNRNQADYAAAFQLYRVQSAQGNSEAAMRTLRKVTTSPSCPKYFHYLEAELCGSRSEFQGAWQAMRRYAGL